MIDDPRLRGVSPDKVEMAISALALLAESGFLAQYAGNKLVEFVNSFDQLDMNQRMAAVERIIAVRQEFSSLDLLATQCMNYRQGQSMETQNENEERIG